jgi:phage anti-repressor protein
LGIYTPIDKTSETNNDMNIGHVLLTNVGKELAPICGSQPDAEFQQYILKNGKKWDTLRRSTKTARSRRLNAARPHTDG